MRPGIALLLPLMLALTALSADVIYLKNGGTISGKIVGVTQTAVTIQSDAGNQTLAKAAVRRIVYGAVEDPEEARKKQEERRKKQEEERKKREELVKDLEKQREEELRRRLEEQKKLEEANQMPPPESRPAPEMDSEATLGGAVWRSAVLPGWGQFYQGRAVEGSIYAGTMLALAGSGAYAGLEYDRSRKAYRNAATALLYTSPLMGEQLGGQGSSTIAFNDPGSVFLVERAAGTAGAANELGSQNLIAAYFMLNELSRYPVESSQFIEKAFYFNLLSQSMLQKKAMTRAAAVTNSLATAALGLYVWNIADAALFHPTGSTYIGFVPMDGQARLAFGYYF